MADMPSLAQVQDDLMTLAGASTNPREIRILLDAALHLSRITGVVVSGAVQRDLVRAAIDHKRRSG
jgi:hypothetical protein